MVALTLMLEVPTVFQTVESPIGTVSTSFRPDLGSRSGSLKHDFVLRGLSGTFMGGRRRLTWNSVPAPLQDA